ncbi:trans-resveratrol di-O-methyltransferase-like [Solanum dulcamara]|uniref:trans-resveratrol di-O-methyltransferase-like n=1 Tax=Solanum dulcamara TaxID=45834 RepID=UPI0024864E7C|nr:trans-resveratrol di-O-methyltransferase-like [Solanum dulcamara]
MADHNENLTPSELLQAETQSWNQLYFFIEHVTLKCALQLDIPNVITKHGKPMTISKLMASLPISPSKFSHFHRLTRILVRYGLLILQKYEENDVDDDKQCYSLAPADRYVVKDGPWNSMEYQDTFFYKAWNCLGYWFKNEDPSAFYTAYGDLFWSKLSRDPSSGNWFNENMARDSRSFINVLIGNEFKDVFEGLTSLVDVGGGTGIIAMSIAKKFPDMKCIVLDLPPVVANLQGSEKLEFVAGDMFQKIPSANAVLLKSILHDWNDEECVKILKNCKEAITGSGKVIIIDMVMENPELDDKSVQAQLFIDMLVMVFLGSKERNKEEWEKLFLDSGFTCYKIILTLGLRSVIELYP